MAELDTERAMPGTAAVVVGDHGVVPFGVTPAERLVRALRRAGVAAIARHPESPPPADRIVVVRADHLYDEAIVRALVARDGVLLVDGKGAALAATVAAADAPALAAALAAGQRVPDGLRHLTATDAGDLAPAYRDALRKRAQPLLVALDGMTRRAAERRLFDDAYKGVTDIVTKYLWPWPAFHATRLAAALGVSANQVTWASLAFVLAALVLFRDGLYLAGLGCAWAMCLLDTVDGKLARVTLASSRFGNALDHGIDLVHPPFWYLAWAAALEDAGFAVRELTLAVVAGYVAGRLQEGLFLWRFGIEMHVWRRFDSRFRLITARRNPNLVLLSVGALAGRPELGFAAVALWTVAAFGLHLVRIGQALIAGRRPGGVRSWLAEPGT